MAPLAQPGNAIEMNSDAGLQHHYTTANIPLTPAFVGQASADQMVNVGNNPTRPTV
jgi:hypothetical protein